MTTREEAQSDMETQNTEGSQPLQDLEASAQQLAHNTNRNALFDLPRELRDQILDDVVTCDIDIHIIIGLQEHTKPQQLISSDNSLLRTSRQCRDEYSDALARYVERHLSSCDHNDQRHFPAPELLDTRGRLPSLLPMPRKPFIRTGYACDFEANLDTAEFDSAVDHVLHQNNSPIVLKEYVIFLIDQPGYLPSQQVEVSLVFPHNSNTFVGHILNKHPSPNLQSGIREHLDDLFHLTQPSCSNSVTRKAYTDDPMYWKSALVSRMRTVYDQVHWLYPGRKSERISANPLPSIEILPTDLAAQARANRLSRKGLDQRQIRVQYARIMLYSKDANTNERINPRTSVDWMHQPLAVVREANGCIDQFAREHSMVIDMRFFSDKDTNGA